MQHRITRLIAMTWLALANVGSLPALATPWEGFHMRGAKALQAASTAPSDQQTRLMDEAEKWYQKALDEAKAFETDNMMRGVSLSGLAQVKAAQGNDAEAEALFKRAVARLRQVKDNPPSLAMTLEHYIKLLKRRDKQSLADKLQTEVDALWQQWQTDTGETRAEYIKSRDVEIEQMDSELGP